jgi:hypothetical protein
MITVWDLIMPTTHVEDAIDFSYDLYNKDKGKFGDHTFKVNYGYVSSD